jgi:hypothetical protein
VLSTVAVDCDVGGLKVASGCPCTLTSMLLTQTWPSLKVICDAISDFCEGLVCGSNIAMRAHVVVR